MDPHSQQKPNLQSSNFSFPDTPTPDGPVTRASLGEQSFCIPLLSYDWIFMSLKYKGCRMIRISHPAQAEELLFKEGALFTLDD
ncbi:hypothetical protein N7486_003247 [Penicillium sp. IBT 16267x]|nr:hypothetical protein N7486_003247 [Penicillium sp. IBT 16267x]